ncbi:MAG: PilW family protein [Telluria sp.]
MRTETLSHNDGFSLVEVLVGMAMGVIVLLIIMQSLSIAEQYKRTATNGSDAQTNGLMALRALESEVRMAGAGITNGALLCPSIRSYYGSAVTAKTIMPALITDGATAALNYSDSIEVLYSSSFTGGAPTQITDAMPSASNVTRVNSTGGMNTCDFVLFAARDGSKSCSMLQITDVSNNNVQFLSSSGQSNFNPPGGAQAALLFPAGGYTTDDIVINLGRNVNRKYVVARDGTNDQFYLQQNNLNAANSNCGPQDANPQLNLISNVVNIQAEYGVANANSQQVTCWTGAATSDNLCSISSGNWSAPVAADVKRIKAVRVAVVVRSAIAEKPSLSGGTCDTTTTAPTSWDGGPPINLSHVPNWQCYRYKVFQTVIPVINVIWANI